MRLRRGRWPLSKGLLVEALLPLGIPLEAAQGSPVRLKLGEEPEELPTQVLEPPKRPRVSWRDALLILLWIVVVAYILLGYFRP